MTPILEAVSHETTYYAVLYHFPSPRPCVPTEKDKRACSKNLSLTSSDTMSSKSLMSFISVCRGRGRLPALADHTTLHHARLCLDTSWREKIRKDRQFQTWRFGNDHSTFALLSLLLSIVRDARVSGCEPRAPVPPLFVKQRRRPLRREQQAEKKRITCGTSKTRSRAHTDHLQTMRRSRTHAILHSCTRKILRGCTLEKSLCCRGAHAQEKFPRIRTTSSS